MGLRTEGVTWREIDGETVILDLKTSKYLTTNRTGTVILRHLAAARSADEIADELVAEFKIPAEQARADVSAFLLGLDQRGLLAPAATG